MKRTANKSFRQMSVKQKIFVAIGIPIMSSLTLVMSAFTGFEQIGKQGHAIYEKVAQAEECGQQTDLLEMLEGLEKRIRVIQRYVIVLALVSVVITTLLAIIVARTIQVQAGSRLPETVWNELAAIRQNMDEILKKY